jgi:hypothetical protein
MKKTMDATLEKIESATPRDVINGALSGSANCVPVPA